MANMHAFDPCRLDDYPDTPGVYLMKGMKGQVLYVGKAKNLKIRLKSYYTGGGDGRVQVPYLLANVATIETIVVPSEKEALLLENTLIKRYQPKYNVLLKDDKGYISLKVTTKHPWPRVLLVRFKGAPPKDGTYYGPYTSATAARQMYDLIGKLFPLRQCSDEEFARRKRPCILYQIKRCCAPCVGKC
jgi:excinuclease ABC subunit C